MSAYSPNLDALLCWSDAIRFMRLAHVARHGDYWRDCLEMYAYESGHLWAAVENQSASPEISRPIQNTTVLARYQNTSQQSGFLAAFGLLRSMLESAFHRGALH